MRAIVRSIVLVGVVAALAHADAHDDVVDVVTTMAAALTDYDVPEFMSAFSKQMPQYDTLKDMVTALVSNAEVSSSIDPVSEEPGDQVYKIDVDWLMQVKSLEEAGPMVRRRELVHCELRKEKKHWKIVSIQPLDFFMPANLGR